ncbi:cation transporter (plasmid) [Massilia varians]
MDTEKKVLAIPIVAGGLQAVNGIIGVVTTGSQAVAVDALFSTVYVVVGIFTFYVGMLLRRPANVSYPFGHAAFEPLVNIIKALLLLGIFIYVAIEAVLAIADGGHPVEYGSVIMFVMISALISCIAAGYAWLLSRKTSTPLIKGEVINWSLDAISIIGVAAAIGIAWLLEENGYRSVADFVDPGIALVLTILTIYMPYKLAKESILEILQHSFSSQKSIELKNIVHSELEELPLLVETIIVVKTGRFIRMLARTRIKDSSKILDGEKFSSSVEKIKQRLLEMDKNIHFDLVLKP